MKRDLTKNILIQLLSTFKHLGDPQGEKLDFNEKKLRKNSIHPFHSYFEKKTIFL